MSYFGNRRKSRQDLLHDAHKELVMLCAKHIASVKDANERELLTDAFTMYMSIKIGDVKREVIVAGYHEAIANASK